MDASFRLGLTCLALAIGVAGGVVGCALDRKRAPEKAVSPPPAAVADEPLVNKAEGPIKLGPPARPRDWQHARFQAAQRLVAANPERTYLGEPPPILLAVPVLTVEVNGDGSVRNISVMRYPSQARDTVKLAIAAVHRAAPYGDVSKLPKPWKFNETFLFNAQRKFKPMTLDRD